MNGKLLNTTRSICPICQALVDAKVYEADNRVYLEKYCLAHGKQTALISSDYHHYKSAHESIRPGQIQIQSATRVESGCPSDCGLCPDHEQHICMPVIEINGSCNLNCPICIADEKNREDLTLDQIKTMVKSLVASEGQIDMLNVSGGEPTLHPQYFEIMSFLSSVEQITKISVSTNGLTLLSCPDLLSFHKKNDILVSIQLDGCRKEVYEKLRGLDLVDEKKAIVDLLVKNDHPFSLIATIGKDINDTLEDVAFLLDLFFTHDLILSLLFQPLVYSGRFAAKINVTDRLTIPDVIRLISEASSGRTCPICPEDFMPLPCCHANCFSLAHFLQFEEKQFIPFKRLLNKDRYIDTIKNRSFFGSDEDSFEQIRSAIFSMWIDAPDQCDCMKETLQKSLYTIKHIIKDIDRVNEKTGKFNPKKTFDVASKKIKSIYIHHFMDADTFDLTRVRRCCTIYPKPDGKFYPMCAYNNLYRNTTHPERTHQKTK